MKRVHAERELSLVVRRMSFGGHSKTLGEGKKSVKATVAPGMTRGAG